ncbi:MAG: hypothetical protein EBS81_12865, partial [Gammaproteobacteria bacterium]|nr:hypothetical protein [Gammaproteobacteria bacterium]
MVPDSVTWDGTDEYFKVPFKVTNFTGIVGLQFSVDFDSDVLALRSVNIAGDDYPVVTGVPTYQVYDGLDPVTFEIVYKDAALISLTDFSVLDKTSIDTDSEVTALWSDPDNSNLSVGRTFTDGTTLFELQFKVIDPTVASTEIGVVSDPTPFKPLPAGEDVTITYASVQSKGVVTIAGTGN